MTGFVRSRRWAQAKRDKNCKGDKKVQRDWRGGLCLKELRWAAGEFTLGTGVGGEGGWKDGVWQRGGTRVRGGAHGGQRAAFVFEGEAGRASKATMWGAAEATHQAEELRPDSIKRSSSGFSQIGKRRGRRLWKELGSSVEDGVEGMKARSECFSYQSVYHEWPQTWQTEQWWSSSHNFMNQWGGFAASLTWAHSHKVGQQRSGQTSLSTWSQRCSPESWVVGYHLMSRSCFLTQKCEHSKKANLKLQIFSRPSLEVA